MSCQKIPTSLRLNVFKMREEKIEPQEGEEIQEEIDSDTEMSGFEHESSDDDNDSSEDDDESSSLLENDEITFNYNECTFQYSCDSIHRFAALSTAPNQHFSDFSDLNLLCQPRDTNSGFEIELKGNEKLNESDNETETASWSESEQEYSNEDNDFSEDDDESSSPEDGDKLALNAITGYGNGKNVQARTLTVEGMLNMDGNKVDLTDEKESESKTKSQGYPRDFVQTQLKQTPDKKEQHKSAQLVSKRNGHTDQLQREMCQSDRPLLRLRLTLKHNERIRKTSACKKRGSTERQNESKELKLQTIAQHLEEEEESETIQKRDTLMEQLKEDAFRIHHRCRQEVENYMSQIHQLKQELDQTFKDRNEVQEINKELTQKTNHFELEIKNLRKDLENEREKSKTNEVLMEKQNIQIEQYEKYWTQAKGEIAANKDLLHKKNTENVQVSETLKKALEDIKENDDLLKKKSAGNNVTKESEVENERQTKKIHDLQTELRAVAKELEETKSRLSRVMGDRLTDNNPNIADLSDQNRPTKLSERYQELYDNQWTDAFESIHQEAHGEEKTIGLLKSIMMLASEFCTEEARKQLNQTAEVFAKGKELPASILKPLKDIRKALAPEYGKVLFKEYFEHLRVSGSELSATAKEIPNFVEECFKICWLMKVQDPPVVLSPSSKTGESFNKDHYKAYTKSGDHISFIVWPALLLHQDGPVLCKGVAQGK